MNFFPSLREVLSGAEDGKMEDAFITIVNNRQMWTNPDGVLSLAVLHFDGCGCRGRLREFFDFLIGYQGELAGGRRTQGLVPRFVLCWLRLADRDTISTILESLESNVEVLQSFQSFEAWWKQIFNRMEECIEGISTDLSSMLEDRIRLRILSSYFTDPESLVVPGKIDRRSIVTYLKSVKVIGEKFGRMNPEREIASTDGAQLDIAEKVPSYDTCLMYAIQLLIESPNDYEVKQLVRKFAKICGLEHMSVESLVGGWNGRGNIEGRIKRGEIKIPEVDIEINNEREREFESEFRIEDEEFEIPEVAETDAEMIDMSINGSRMYGPTDWFKDSEKTIEFRISLLNRPDLIDLLDPDGLSLFPLTEEEDDPAPETGN